MLSKARNLSVMRPLVNWLHQLVPDRYLPITVLGGVLRGRRLMLNLHYQMGYWLGLTEPDVAAAMQAMIAPGDVVYDVGAEVGYFSIMAAIMSRTGCVYAFEPNPANLPVLHQTAALNRDLDLIIIPKAVGNACRQAEFLTFSHREDVENASLLGRLAETAAGETTSGSVVVDMIDLDSFSAETRVTPDVIKIDVEGAEGLVLQGMARLLVEARPRFIIEIHSEIAERDVMICLTAHNYDTRTIGRTFDRAYPFRVLSLPVPMHDLRSGQ